MLSVPYSSPISVALYPQYGMLSLGVGFSVTAGYFIYRMKSGNKNLFLEALLIIIASIFLGFGTLFAMLSFELYV